VQAGLARHYTRYSDDPELAAAESRARAARLNLWSLPEARDGVAEEETGGEGSVRSPPGDGGGSVYHGNEKSRVFHAPGCRHYDCPNCTVVFASREEALRANYRPAGDCHP